MKPYQFFCYVAKYFKKLDQLEHKPTPEREAQVNRLRIKIEEEIERVAKKVGANSIKTTPNY